MQPNEIKLLQFIALVDAVIREIVNLKEDPNKHSLRELQGLEARITKTILPVKARLQERWQQQQNRMEYDSSNSHTPQGAINIVENSPSNGTTTPGDDNSSINSGSVDGRESLHVPFPPVPGGSAQKHTILSASPTSISNYARNLSAVEPSAMKLVPNSSSTSSGLTHSQSSSIMNAVKSNQDPEPLELPPVLTLGKSLELRADVISKQLSSSLASSETTKKGRQQSSKQSSSVSVARDAPVPRGRLDLNESPEDCHPLVLKSELQHYDPHGLVEVEPLEPYFVIDEDVEVNENIFDNVPDCSIDLYDEDGSTHNSGYHGLYTTDHSVGFIKSDMDHHTNDPEDFREIQKGKRTYATSTMQSSSRTSSYLPISSESSVATGLPLDPKLKSSGISSASLLSHNTAGSSALATKPAGPYYSSAVDIDLKSSMLVGNVPVREEEYMSSRRRRRLNQIVPNPRKPRSADYTCSLCEEGYSLTVEANPWWAVYRHECPHCKQTMIPRIDISQANNAIELDPNVIALYGEGIDDSGDDGEDDYSYEDEDDDGMLEDMTTTNGGGGSMSVDGEIDNGESGLRTKSIAEEEEIIFDGEGLLSKEEASRLLVLMCHARGCSGVHSSPKHTEICKSTKFLMLHIRDCKGVDIHGRECLFPWCAPCKKMLKHLSQCYEPTTCSVCNPW